LGSGVYTSLYLALAGRTSLFTKTTTADIGAAFLKQAGLVYLLADDDVTPQALIHGMALHLARDFADMDPLQQAAEQQRLAFAAQKGWYYEEWGGQLQAMMAPNGGVMAGFRTLLRVLDDHKIEYTYATVGRGRETLHKPYLSLLANVTPADLQPFAKQQSSLWRDGFLARFAFCVPETADAGNAQFPRGQRTLPAQLVRELHDWHIRLGVPTVTISLVLDNKGKPKPGAYRTEIGPLPETTYQLHDATWDAFYAYDAALRSLLKASKAEHLDGCYVRLPGKALRIAALLAALHDVTNHHTIYLNHWQYAVRIVEGWRRDLHRLLRQMHAPTEPVESREARQERRIQEVLRRHGTLTVRGIHVHTKLAYTDIATTCETLVGLHILTKHTTGKSVKYGLSQWHEV
jgi:hypothetical protein